MLGRTLFDRYHLDQVLGRSGSGTLYLATDQSTGETSGEMLAIRFSPLPKGGMEEERLLFRGAAERLRKLGHAHLLLPREVIEAEDGIWEILPYWPARSLAARLEAGALPLEEGVALLCQVAQALEVLHAAGVCHHNLKPSNVLETGEGEDAQWVLADAARSLLRGLPGSEAGPEAAAYQAPEQGPWLNDRPGPAADWFALGLVAYQALTGAFPYAGATTWEMQRHHVVTSPESPRRHRADIPPALERILLTLLAKRPEDRYACATDLLADLEHWSAPVSALPSSPGDESLREALHDAGRRDLGHRLRAALGQTATGEGRLVVLKGGRGMGRGDLLEGLLPDIAAARGLLLRAEVPSGEWCAPFEVPLQWFENLLDQWEHLPDLHRRDLLHRLHSAQGHHAAVLRAVHPGLAPLLPAPDPLPPLPLGGARHRTLHALCESIRALADPRTPLVLWVAEAQQCDADSFAFLRLLVHRLADTPVLVILTVTGGGANGMAHWENRLLSGSEGATVQIVEVPPLTVEQAAVLLQRESGGALERASAQRLAQWACGVWGGSPLSLRLAWKLIQQRNLLLGNAGHPKNTVPPKTNGGESTGPEGSVQGRIDWPALEAASWPEGLAGLAGHLIELLPEESLLILQALAATAEGCTFAGLCGLLEHLPPSMVRNRLESLFEGQWLRERRGFITFVHEVLREAVVAQTPNSAQEVLHGTWGSNMEAASPEGAIRHHHRAALHFEHAGDSLRGGEQGYRALAACWEAQALGGVSFWSARLQPLFREDDRLADLLVSGGIARVQLGHPAAGRSLLESARALSLNEKTELECLAFIAWADMEQGDQDSALERIEEGLALEGESLPTHPVGSALSRLAGRAAHHYEHFRHKATGAEPSPPSPREEALIHLLGLASLLLSQSQPQRAVLADEKIVHIASARTPTSSLVRALVRLGEGEGDPESGFLAEARHLLDRHAFPQAEAEYRLAIGRVNLAQGSWAAAREALNIARSGFHTVGDLSGEWRALRELLELDRLQGPTRSLLVHSREALRLAGLGEHPARIRWSEAFRAYADFMASEHPGNTLAETCAVLRGAGEGLAELGAWDEGAYLLALSGELAFCDNDWGSLLEAVRMAARLPRIPAGSGGLLLRKVLTEAHLLQARVFPDEQAHHLRQAHLASKPLLRHRESAARLEPELALCEAMEILLDGETEAARALVEARLPALDGSSVRLTAGWLRFRLAEALKSAHDPAWLRWGGQALADFEAMGAQPHLSATRKLLELETNPEAAEDGGDPLLMEKPPGIPHPVEGDDLWDLLAHGGPRDEAQLLSAWLEGVRGTLGAESAQVFRPNGDGQLERRVHSLAHSPGRQDTPPPGHRWLVDAVWRDRRPQVVSHYRPPAEADGFGDPQSFLCAPLQSGEQGFGVVLLASGVSRQVFDGTHLARLKRLSHQAATALALNTALTRAQTERGRLQAESIRISRDQDWAYHAASEENLPGLLGRFREEVNTRLPAQSGCLGVLMALNGGEATADGLNPGLGGDALAFGAWEGRELPSNAWEQWFPLPLSGGQAALAMERQVPIPVRPLSEGQSHPPPSEAEQRLLNGLGAGGGLWLPLLHRGEAFGVVLLLHAQALFPDAEESMAGLRDSLRILMPAVYHLHRLEEERRRSSREREQRSRLAGEMQMLRALMPPGMGGSAGEIGEAVSRGVERVAPFLVGEVPGLAQPLGQGKDELLRTLRFYFERVNHGLEMHKGALASIHHRHWVAHYHGAADSALWGAQTLYQMLLSLREEAADQGLTLPPTGLGLHMGNSLWGALPSGERLAPFVLGGGVRDAARLAAMSISFRCGILVSESLVQALENPERFDLRHLGKLRPAPGESRIEVYELFSVREETERDPMRSMQPVWDEALRAYQMGSWHTAAGRFNAYIAELPHDRPARYFLRQCRERSAS